MYTETLTEGAYFHIYNRGVNGEDIFKEHRNYFYFLQQYKKYCAAVFETYAYALLKNHFHLLVYIKENVTVSKNNGQGIIQLNASRQLSHFFNSYAQAINKAHNRTGPLFESPFKRKEIDDDHYLTALICYCHCNAQKHGFVEDFKDWEFSSYRTIISVNNDFVKSQKILDWFGNVVAFQKAHEGRYESEALGNFIID